MTELTSAIHGTIHTARHATPITYAEEALCIFIRSMNTQVITAASTPATPLPPHADVLSQVDTERLLCAFMWMTPCCRETVHISDTYNAMHLCGIVVCKFLYVCTRTHPHIVLDELFTFPGGTTMHVAPGPIALMPYDDLVQVLSALQHEWPRLCTVAPDHALVTVLACMARFGSYMLYPQTDVTLDDPHTREPINDNTTKLRPTKRCTRAVINTTLCLLRNAVMLWHASRTPIQVVDPPTVRQMVYDALFQNENTVNTQLSQTVRACAMRVRHIETSILGTANTADIDDVDMLWAYLTKKLGAPLIGEAPRKRDIELVSFLQDAVLFVSQQARLPADMVICGAAMRVLETALKYFYIVPSADKFRHIALLETVSSGHRLNYAHDYCHFDTGQLSQVVYLHNPLFKQSPPPTGSQDWVHGSSAGPLAALCQLLPDLQVWYEDCQDPLGFLQESAHITRPSDNDATTVHMPGHTRWVLIVSTARVLLVDRSCSQIDMVPAATPPTPEHHALGLLMLYLYKTNQIHTITTVAINGYKIRNTKNVPISFG